jgi:hypothetical protein
MSHVSRSGNVSHGSPSDHGTGGSNKDTKYVADKFGVNEKTMHDILGRQVDAKQGKGLSTAERDKEIAKLSKGYAKDIGSANIPVGSAVDAWRSQQRGAPGAIGG